MRQSLLSVAFAAFALTLTACSDEDSQAPFIYSINGDGQEHDGHDHAAQETASGLLAEATVYPVACGCSQGGACANLVEVDGEYIPLKGELGASNTRPCPTRSWPKRRTGVP